MLCPTCKRKSKVIWTEQMDPLRSTMRRRRECRPCGLRWNTSETKVGLVTRHIRKEDRK